MPTPKQAIQTVLALLEKYLISIDDIVPHFCVKMGPIRVRGILHVTKLMMKRAFFNLDFGHK